MTWIDISQPLHSGIPVWPGDAPFQYEFTYTKEESGSVNVGQVQMSTHTGTHIDAPFHFDEAGSKVNELDVNLYIGKARVIDLPGREKIKAEDLMEKEWGGISRLLIRTDSWRDRNVFPEEICHLDPDAVPYLKKQGIRLIGLDVPSVDPIDSKTLPAHHALWDAGIHILEGAVLDNVEEGIYELIALPLPILGGDGSPVRAVIRPVAESL